MREKLVTYRGTQILLERREAEQLGEPQAVGRKPDKARARRRQAVGHERVLPGDEAFAQRLQQLGIGRHAGDDRGSEAPLTTFRGVAGGPEGRLQVRPREGSGTTRQATFPLEVGIEQRAEPLHHGGDERGTRVEVIEDPAFADAGLVRRGFEGEVGDAVA